MTFQLRRLLSAKPKERVLDNVTGSVEITENTQGIPEKRRFIALQSFFYPFRFRCHTFGSLTE
jgi:hypothetical protein